MGLTDGNQRAQVLIMFHYSPYISPLYCPILLLINFGVGFFYSNKSVLCFIEFNTTELTILDLPCQLDRYTI